MKINTIQLLKESGDIRLSIGHQLWEESDIIEQIARIIKEEVARECGFDIDQRSDDYDFDVNGKGGLDVHIVNPDLSPIQRQKLIDAINYLDVNNIVADIISKGLKKI